MNWSPDKVNNENTRLCELIQRLSKQNNYINEKKLLGNDVLLIQSIYNENFRHNYSKISNTIYALLNHDIDCSELLSMNLEILSHKIYLDDKIDGTVKLSLYKLIDHINLEIGRYNLKGNDNEDKKKDSVNVDYSKDIENLDKKLNSINDEHNKIYKRALESMTKNEVEDKLDKNNLSSITTLTIFSAVILAFSGGISYASGVFDGLDMVSIYRLIFITGLVGLIVFNTIFLLLFIVGRMVNKRVSCICCYEKSNKDILVSSCENCLRKFHKSNIFCKLIHKYPYIVFINAITLAIMYYSSVLYVFNYPHILHVDQITNYLLYLLISLPLLLLLIAKFYFNICDYTFKKFNMRYFAHNFLFNAFNENKLSQFIQTFKQAFSTYLKTSSDDTKDSGDEIKTLIIENIKKGKDIKSTQKLVYKHLIQYVQSELISYEPIQNIDFKQYRIYKKKIFVKVEREYNNIIGNQNKSVIEAKKSNEMVAAASLNKKRTPYKRRKK